MESVYPKLALCGSKHECARTDTVFFCICEASNGTFSLSKAHGFSIKTVVINLVGEDDLPTLCQAALDLGTITKWTF